MASATTPPPPANAPAPADARRRHRLVVVAAGSLAVSGAILAGFVHPAWALLAAAGGLALLLFPDRSGHAA
jgi:hypothetical protein